MRYLVSFLNKCLQIFIMLLCVLAHLFLGCQFVILIGHLGKERIARATLKHLQWGVVPYDLRYALYPHGDMSSQAHFTEWRPVTKEMWTVYDRELSDDDIR